MWPSRRPCTPAPRPKVRSTEIADVEREDSPVRGGVEIQEAGDRLRAERASRAQTEPDVPDPQQGSADRVLSPENVVPEPGEDGGDQGGIEEVPCGGEAGIIPVVFQERIGEVDRVDVVPDVDGRGTQTLALPADQVDGDVVAALGLVGEVALVVPGPGARSAGDVEGEVELGYEGQWDLGAVHAFGTEEVEEDPAGEDLVGLGAAAREEEQLLVGPRRPLGSCVAREVDPEAVARAEPELSSPAAVPIDLVLHEQDRSRHRELPVGSQSGMPLAHVADRAEGAAEPALERGQRAAAEVHGRLGLVAEEVEVVVLGGGGKDSKDGCCAFILETLHQPIPEMLLPVEDRDKALKVLAIGGDHLPATVENLRGQNYIDVQGLVVRSLLTCASGRCPRDRDDRPSRESRSPGPGAWKISCRAGPAQL